MKLDLAIRAYDVGAVFDNFDDGSFQSFDAITAEIAGGERTGQLLRILVESNSDLARRWNHPGSVLTATIDPERLATQILSASAFNLEAGGAG
jgi:hypothetical protein